jgi:E3 ubiquitin-protein ligase HUWE1
MVSQTSAKSSQPADIAALIKYISDAPDNELVSQLEKVQKWVYPRGDLYSWSAILDRFDALLEAQTKQYNLETIQVVDFTASDKQLILEILRFTRLLLENSTNRKSFASYDVSHPLNSSIANPA